MSSMTYDDTYCLRERESEQMDWKLNTDASIYKYNFD